MRTERVAIVLILLLICTQFPHANASQVSSSTVTGYIRMIPDNGTSAPAGVAIIGLHSAGTVISETGVPSSAAPIRSGRIFVEIYGTVNTGIALANPNNHDVTVSYYFTDSSGSDFASETLILPANHQIASFLSQQPFDLAAPFTGTFTFSSSHPVVAAGLRNLVNERNEALITTMPVSDLGGGYGGTTLLIPRYPSEQGTTQVVLVNPGDTQLTGIVVFYGQGSIDGYAQPVRVMVDGVASPIFSYTVPPRGVFRMSPAQESGGAPIGSVRITPSLASGKPSSLAFSSYRRGGVTVSAASVPALPAASAFRMYIESAGVFGQNESIQTQINFSNPSVRAVTVEMRAMKLDGTWSGNSASITVPSVGQISRFVNELFPQLPSTFRGVMTINASSPLVVTGVRGRYNSRGDLLIMNLPPYDAAAAPLPEAVLPYFISGPGSFSQLILLSTGFAHTGSLLLVSQEGVALPGSSLQLEQ